MAELPGCKSPAHFDECGLETPLMADAQLNTGGVRGRDRGFRIYRRRAQWLLAEDMPSRFRGGNELLRMLRLWGAKDDGIDILVRQRVLEPRRGCNTECRCCGPRLLLWIDAEHRSDDRIVQQRLEDRLSPPSQTNDSGLD